MLKPWRDYVPVREDLADLHEKYLWAVDNPRAAERIAQAGRQVAAQTTGYQAVRSAVVSALRAMERYSFYEPVGRTWPLSRFDTQC